MIKPSISVIIITKDAESCIGRALESIKGIADQIVVIDTGSSDYTPRICSLYGAELHFHKWENSFSEARNYALNFARCEWSLIIDSDEELNIDSFMENIDKFSDESVVALRCNITNFLEGDVVSKHQYPRMFRNNEGFIFEGDIHEQIGDSIQNAGFEISDSTVEIFHYGYQEIKQEKIDRNIEMLSVAAEKEPDDGFASYHLAESYFAGKNYEKSLKYFSSAISSESLNIPQKELAHIRKAQIFLAKDDFESSEKELQFVSEDLNREGLRKFVYGAVSTQKYNFLEAITYFNSSECKNSSLVPQDKLNLYITKFNEIINKKS